MKNHLLILSLIFIASLISCKNEQETKKVERPNILFAISDDQSFPHAGAYGCTWVKTPAFDRIAKEGLLGIAPVASGMQPITGKNLLEIFKSELSGKITDNRNFVLIGKERHDVGRPNDEGYPVRGIIQGDYALTLNFEPNRWPVGNPETGYLNTDGSPTKTVILNERRRTGKSEFWDLNFGKRPAEELYNIQADPWCVNNIATETDLAAKKAELKALLVAELKKQGDPRILGQGAIFDNYQYAHPSSENFYERFTNGEEMKAGWVNPSDFEKEKID